MKKKTSKSLLWLLTLIVAMMSISFTTMAADEIEPNNGSNAATIISSDTLHKGSINSTDDIDWYKFTNSRDYFTLTFSIDSTVDFNEIGDGWSVNIYSSDGKSVIKSYSGITADFTTPILPFDGTFLIEVKSAFHLEAPVDCVYNLKVNTVTNSNWESEKNDTSATADKITVTNVHKGIFYKPEDVDWYKFTNSKDYFTLDFSIDSTVDYNVIGDGWIVNIYSSDGRSIIKSYSNITADFTTPVLPFKGDYYIEVKPDFHLAAPVDCIYNIKINTVSSSNWESELNDTSSAADKISTGKNYYGALYHNDDIDWYIVETKTGAFNVILTLDESVSYDSISDGWKISIYPYGSTKAIVTYNNVQGNLKSFDIPYKGKFTIKVQADFHLNAPVDCIYKLKVTQHKAEELWESEKNDTKEKSTNLTSKNNYNANFDHGEDVDFFKYKATSKGEIRLDFSRVESDTIGDGFKISVLNKDGKVLFEANDVTDSSLRKNGIKIAKGETVYIKVCPSFHLDAPVYINYKIRVTFTQTLDATKKITVTSGADSIKASWNKVTGASGYKVELLNSKGKVVKKVTTTKTSYTFKKLSKVTTYKIRVTAYKTIDKKAVYSTVSTTITTSTAPAKVTLSKVTAGSKSATPAWKAVSGASGYQVQYSTSSKFKSAKTATVKKGSSKKTTIKKLTKGKKYYFKVRAYKTVGSTKVYGAWSSVKSVKVK